MKTFLTFYVQYCTFAKTLRLVVLNSRTFPFTVPSSRTTPFTALQGYMFPTSLSSERLGKTLIAWISRLWKTYSFGHCINSGIFQANCSRVKLFLAARFVIGTLNSFAFSFQLTPLVNQLDKLFLSYLNPTYSHFKLTTLIGLTPVRISIILHFLIARRVLEQRSSRVAARLSAYQYSFVGMGFCTVTTQSSGMLETQ